MAHDFADRLRSTTRAYEKRLAAERMAEVPMTAGELAQEGVVLMKERIAELERENEELRAEVLQLRKELDAGS